MAKVYPQPLPPNSYNPSTEAPLHDAYKQCLNVEAGAGADKDTLMLARCLGYLIRELPYEANEIIAHEIVACNADFDKMGTLSRLYIDHLIRLFRRNKDCTGTPPPSEHPSPPSKFETHSNPFSEAVEPAPTDHQTAKKSALRRDNYRCVVTGWVDSSSFWSMEPADLQRYNLNQNPPLRSFTNYCHIFPPLTNGAFNPNDPAMKIIHNILSELDGGRIHHLENGFTMDMMLHTLFDDLRLWFEHVAVDPHCPLTPSQDNTYRVCSLDPGIAALSVMPPSRTIIFTSTDPCLPLPNPKYLRLHAAICRVAHLSGAAGYLNLEDSQIDSLGVLARDGSSADLLSSRLRHMALMA